MAMPTFNIDPGTSAESIAMRRRIAEALMSEASSGRVNHWTQGLNRIAQGLVGGYDAYSADESEKAQRAEAQRLVGGLFDLGTDPQAEAVSASPGAVAAPPAASAIPSRASPAARAQVSDITSRIVQAESGGRSNLKNPNSSATGPGQFIDSTWLDMIKRHRPDLMQGKTPEQVLAMRADPDQAQLSKDMTAAYEQENGARLRAAGLEATPANLYAMHFFGPGDGIKVLKAAPNTPLNGLVSPASLQANQFLQGMTAGRAQRWAAKKMGEGGASPASSQAESTKNRRVQRAVELWGNPQTRPLAQAVLAKYLGETATDTMREYDLARSQGYKGTVLDYQKELKQAGKTEGSMLTDDLKEYNFATQQGFKGSYADWEGMKKAKGLSPGDKKAINEAEDTIPVVENTLLSLRQARELNEKTFTGLGAETGGWFGTSGVPGADYVVDKDRAKATREWQALMTPEALQSMSDTLKGATTDFELRQFIKMIADPSTPVDQRGRAIDKLIGFAEKKERIAKERLQQIREGTYYQPGGGASSGSPTTSTPDGGKVEFVRGPDGKLQRK